jgi:anti-anti-sigma factor
MSATSYQVARLDRALFIKSVGLANMKNAPILDVFLRAEMEQGVTSICIDLSSCTGMDSTFMGMLVGHRQDFENSGGQLIIVNPSAGNLRLLTMLGVSVVVPIAENQALPEMEFVSLASDPKLSTVQRMELVQKAHQNLLKLNGDNKDKFSTFLQTLEADLKKFKAKG